jgi:hypothetical protein
MWPDAFLVTVDCLLLLLTRRTLLGGRIVSSLISSSSVSSTLCHSRNTAYLCLCVFPVSPQETLLPPRLRALSHNTAYHSTTHQHMYCISLTPPSLPSPCPPPPVCLDTDLTVTRGFTDYLSFKISVTHSATAIQPKEQP